MTQYKKTQKGFIISILFAALIVVIAIYYLSENISELFLYLMVSVLTACILLFYKLTITIKEETITALLGVGFLKRKVAIKDIDFSTLEKVNFSLLTGIGIRLTSKGWLWNVKIGDAIYFKTKNNKTFLVGTDEADEIIKILKNE